MTAREANLKVPTFTVSDMIEAKKKSQPTKRSEELSKSQLFLTPEVRSQHLLSPSLLNQSQAREFKDWELGKIKVFLLAGRIEAGKSTVAKVLKSALHLEYPSATITVAGFADGVKHVARTAFGWDGKKDTKGRRLLQVVGTDAGREYDHDIWAKMAYELVTGAMIPSNIYIFDDWRFPNEYDYWTDKPEIGKIYKIRVFRDSEKISDHLSEKSLPISLGTPDYYDYRFDNNGDSFRLMTGVRKMLQEIL